MKKEAKQATQHMVLGISEINHTDAYELCSGQSWTREA